MRTNAPEPGALPTDAARPGGGSLQRVIGPIRFFALAFGCIVGSGWVVVLTAWLQAAGPIGAVLAFCAAVTVMLAVAGCYAELASRLPRAGGEVLYAREAFGPSVSFCVGWLLLLSLGAVVSFEGIALPWMLEEVVPGLRSQPLYVIYGQPVTMDALALGAGGVAVVTSINYFGARPSSVLQTAGTGVFLVLASVVIILGFVLGSPHNVAPAFAHAENGTAWMGIVWIFATAPVWLNGFQAVAQAIEERKSSVSFGRVAMSMYAALAVAAAFYCGIILATSMSIPWRDLRSTDFATVRAMKALLPGEWAAKLVLIAAAVSVFKTWNGVFLWAVRLTLGKAREGFLPAPLRRIHSRWQSPHVAVLALGVINLLGVALGRGVIIPIVNVASICLAVSLAVACTAAVRMRYLDLNHSQPGYAIPGGRWTIGYALLGSSSMAAFAVWEPWARARGSIPLEWELIALWTAAGLFVWRVRAWFERSRTRATRAGSPASQ